MPIGYLVTVGLLAIYTLFALVPPIPKHSSPSNISYWLGSLINELPFIALYWLLFSTGLAFYQGDIGSPGSWVVVGLAVLTACGLILIAKRGSRGESVIETALDEDLGDGWRYSLNNELKTDLRTKLPLGRILFAPFFVRNFRVKRNANISYGDAGKRNLLDVYHHRSTPAGAPVMIYFHGGAFRSGWKNREARLLHYRLASKGWVCISANYRLQPKAKFPDHLVDFKKVIAWVRENGHEYGADPSTLFVAGSSAGGHLASMAGLTQNDPAFQPGFEDADTSVTGVVSLYGFYGSAGGNGHLPSTPLAYLNEDAPPFFVTHGDKDTLVIVKDARKFVKKLRAESLNPVVYAELPGAQHSFDLFLSLRFDAVVNGIEAFAAWVRSTEEKRKQNVTSKS